MTALTSNTVHELVTVDEVYDREYSSDGISRFGAYLRQRAHLFVDEGEPLGPVGLAVLAWDIANSPVMSPGYVELRPDIHSIRCRHADEPGGMVADVAVRLRRPDGLRRCEAVRGWRSWTEQTPWSHDSTAFYAPGDDAPALLITAHLWLPIPEAALPAPPTEDPLDTVTAKRAIAVVREHVNGIAGPAVAALRGGWR